MISIRIAAHLSLLALSSHLYAGSLKLIAYGHTEKNQKYELLLRSSDDAKVWKKIDLGQVLPESVNNIIFRASDCSKTMCYGAGYYSIKNGENKAFLIRSNLQDHRHSFTYINDLFNKPVNINIEKLRCYEDRCYMIGNIAEPNTVLKPLILQTTDNGDTWQSHHEITLPNPYEYGILSDISCQKKNCVAVGHYTTRDKIGFLMNAGLILLSNDAGLTWKLPKIMPTPPKSLFKQDLSHLYCKQNHCVVGGDYEIHQMLDKPLLWQSHDLGVTWEEVDLEKVLNIRRLQSGWVKAIETTQESLIVIGSFFNGAWRGFILNTSDEGKHWKFINDYEDVKTVTFDAISCNWKNCTITGNYDLRLQLYHSTDYGRTWLLSNQKTSESMANVFIYDSVCQGAQCLTSGARADANSKFVPFLMTSNDMGRNWQNIPSSALDYQNADRGILQRVSIQKS